MSTSSEYLLSTVLSMAQYVFMDDCATFSDVYSTKSIKLSLVKSSQFGSYPKLVSKYLIITSYFGWHFKNASFNVSFMIVYVLFHRWEIIGVFVVMPLFVFPLFLLIPVLYACFVYDYDYGEYQYYEYCQSRYESRPSEQGNKRDKEYDKIYYFHGAYVFDC